MTRNIDLDIVLDDGKEQKVSVSSGTEVGKEQLAICFNSGNVEIYMTLDVKSARKLSRAINKHAKLALSYKRETL